MLDFSFAEMYSFLITMYSLWITYKLKMTELGRLGRGDPESGNAKHEKTAPTD